MSRIGAKRRFRKVVFYVCATVAVALLLMYRTSIWLGAVALLNSLAETFDSLAGR